jgi:hypothetical protein
MKREERHEDNRARRPSADTAGLVIDDRLPPQDRHAHET